MSGEVVLPALQIQRGCGFGRLMMALLNEEQTEVTNILARAVCMIRSTHFLASI